MSVGSMQCDADVGGPPRQRLGALWVGSTFGPTFLGLVDSKVFQLGSCFQLLSQPPWLCSSTSPCVTRFVSIFDWDCPTSKRASTHFHFGATEFGKIIS